MRRMLGCMQPDGRALFKPERQRLIVSLISSRSLRTQQELQAALAGAGCEVTQATISRDLRELGVKKGRDQLGQPRFTLAEVSRRGSPEDALVSVLRRFALRVVASQNLVIVRCELGTAPAVAQALDRTENPRILGTLAGDDTCLVVTTGGATAARSVARTLRRSIET
jgi:transcriptional regulator of arginine metabolism